MRKLFLFLPLLLLVAACEKKPVMKSNGLLFTDDVRLSATPVKNQGHTSLCWIYAMLATIETEHIMQGDSVHLSVDYVARAFLREQALEAGHCGATVGKRDALLKERGATLTERGMMPMTLRLIATYGLTHYDAYHRADGTDLDMLRQQLQLVCNGTASLTERGKRVDVLLDRAFGEVMPHIFFLGAQYTPLEFAHSVCRDDEYEALTSFTHHAFGTRFPLEVADNYYHDTFLNIPMDTLFRRVVTSLRTGHPVCWEGDISEPGFAFPHGTATLRPGVTVSQEERQREFENGQTTDDHCMEIVGLAHDQNGRRYFLMKNSWGTNNRFGGYMYVSEDYFKLKTIAVLLPA